MVPKKEKANILKITHETHLGQEMMITQLRGKVFWHKKKADLQKLVTECEPCQRQHRSHAKERVEVSHDSYSTSGQDTQYIWISGSIVG